ncbi:MAG: ribosomal protein S18-alanine N-acetyltransferase [Terriglobia bacterium]
MQYELKAGGIRIRPFTPEDAPGVVSVERRAFAASRWTETDYRRLAQQEGSIILVGADRAGRPGGIAGFIALRQLFDEAEILNLAVEPACQRRGVARALIEAVLIKLQEGKVRTAYLEVRPSNHAAIRLYFSVGFIVDSVRKGYYSGPREDAYVFRLSIPPARREIAAG